MAKEGNRNGFFCNNGLREGPANLPNSSRHPSVSPYMYNLIPVALFPLTFAMGSMGLSLLGQSILLTSAPPVAVLACAAACAALLAYPLVLLAHLGIDYCFPENDIKNHMSNTLLHIASLMLNIHFSAYLATLAGYKMMTIYAVYAIFGAGIVPAVIIGAAAILLTRDLHNKMTINNSERNVIENTIDEDSNEAESQNRWCPGW